MLQVVLSLGLGLIIYAGKAGGDDWKEFIRYFRESKFVSYKSLVQKSSAVDLIP